MAENLGEAILHLTTDGAALEQGLNTAKARADQLAKSFAQTGKKLSLYLTAPLVGAGVMMVRSAGKQEEALAALNNAIRATGHETDISVDALAALASQLQSVTTFGDEAQLSALALLQQLGGLDEEGLKALLPRLLDFATAMGVDLETAASLVGKTLGSSTNALSRYGIELDMSTDKTDRLAQLTAALEEKFSGAAETAGRAGLGPLVQLKNSLGDLAEMFGDLILPYVKDLADRLKGAISWISGLDEGTKRFILTVAGVAAAIGPALLALSAVIKAVQGIGIAIKVVSALMNATIATTPVGIILAAIALLVAAAILIIQNWDAISAFFQELWDKVVGIFQTAISAIKAFLAEHWDEILIALTGPIGLAVVQIIKHWDDIKAAFQAALDFIINIVNRIKEELTERLSMVTEPVKKVAEGIKGAFGWLKDQLVGHSIVPEIVDGILGEWGRLAGGTSATFEDMARKVTGNLTRLVGYLSTIWDSYYEALLNNEALSDEERTRLLKKRAIANKAMAIFQVAIDTAAAIMHFLVDPGGIPGVVLSIAAGVAGIAQGIAIASEPIPTFAAGGSFVVPPGYPNDSYLMGVQSGEQVDVTPAGERGADEMLHVIVNLDGRPILDTVSKASRDGRLILFARSVTG